GPPRRGRTRTNRRTPAGPQPPPPASWPGPPEERSTVSRCLVPVSPGAAPPSPPAPLLWHGLLTVPHPPTAGLQGNLKKWRPAVGTVARSGDRATAREGRKNAPDHESAHGFCGGFSLPVARPRSTSGDCFTSTVRSLPSAKRARMVSPYLPPR